MVGQFEAEKCLHAASTDNLVLMIIADKSDPGNPQAIEMVQISGSGLKVGANPPRGGC